MIKYVNGKFDDYSNSPKIRQILLHWGYELVENDLLWFFVTKIFFTLKVFVHTDMTHYWFNRPELLEKAKDKYHNCGGKEKDAKYYHENKDVMNGKGNNKYKSLSKDEKEAKKYMEEIGLKIWKKKVL